MLIVHSRGDRMVHVANGRYLAAAMPDARYLEVDGDDHVWQMSPNWRQIQDELISFVTGERPAPRTSAFAVVLFTDIVNSTAQEAALGDQRWLARLDDHDRIAHALITRQGGRIVKHLGDGLLATFMDPATGVTATCQFVAEMAAVGMPVRAGLHAGAIEVRVDGDIGGITVNIAARVQAHAGANEVVVTRTLRELLLGTSLQFTELGERDIKGIDGPWSIYAATLP
jgi:class 3 adenylate cyclase